MSAPWATVLTAVLGAWSVALLGGAVAAPALLHRRGWERVHRVAPAFDLVGMWAGAIAALALAVGRRGFTFGWAATLLLVALMVTAALYHRAVLVPSMDAARRRADHDAGWSEEWRFLWRMSHAARVLGLALALLALWISFSL
jgi:hypothetical protein